MKAQSKDSVDIFDEIASDFRYDTLRYSKTVNREWAANSQTLTYQNQGDNHSIYLAVNDDSTFVFFSVFEVGYFLTVGRYSVIQTRVYQFHWDKEKSLSICRDKKLYSRYFQYSTPAPLKISDWRFIKSKGALLPVRQ